MKRILVALMFLFLCAGMSLAVDYPHYVGYVNDFAGVLDDATSAKLSALCKDLEAKTSDELAIVTVKSVEPLDSKSYAVGLFKEWGIGKKGKDNGILLLLAMKERRVEIEVGYGLEGALNDAKCGGILHDKVIPCFKASKWGDGLVNGATAIVLQLSNTNESVSSTDKQNVLGRNLLIIFIVILVILVIVAVAVNSDNTSFFGGGSFGGGSSGGGGAGGGF